MNRVLQSFACSASICASIFAPLWWQAAVSDERAGERLRAGHAKISTAGRMKKLGSWGFEIQSLDYLHRTKRYSLEIEEARVTYYVLVKSNRLAYSALPSCLQEHIRAHNLDSLEYQFTCFLDRVLIAGSGVLSWKGHDYFVGYDVLKRHGWSSGRRGLRNRYECSSFAYRSKQSGEFIEKNINRRELFTPLSETPFPNGRTASGQAAIDWRSLAVNPADFPLSVPNPKLRETLTKKFQASGKRPPQPRVFVVLEFSNGRKFLTEATDTGSGVNGKAVDWRIGNTPEEIRFFHSLGGRAKAICFAIDSERVNFEEVLEKCRE